jgi:hypothetical protein
VRIDAVDAAGRRSGTVFMGTVIATGAARARVTATGMRTAGRIALLAVTEARPPLQRQLGAVGRRRPRLRRPRRRDRAIGLVRAGRGSTW